MALFDKAFNAFAQYSNTVNRGINSVIGKDVIPEMKTIEAPREFQALDHFPEYSVPKPEQWPALIGDGKSFCLEGNIISISAHLDACMQYRTFFKTSAKYYTE